MMPDGENTSEAVRPDSLLKSRANPRNGLDYIVAHAGTLGTAGRHVALRYVPDKLLVEAQSLAALFASLADNGAAEPEATALAVLDEMNNEIVPRWVQIAVSVDDDGGNGSVDALPMQTVIIEDRQPNWDNPSLLNRLPPL